MLIYNYKKEFLGIDEADIQALGLSDLADLRAESADFADLFLKTPGHIHNFKHVHWIDYVLDGSGAQANAIIHIKNKNFSTIINIKTIYLVDNPSSNAYLVELTNLRMLSKAELDRLSSDISTRVSPVSTTETTELFTEKGSIAHEPTAPRKNKAVAFDPYEDNEPDTTTKVDMYEKDLSLEEDFAVDETPLEIDTKELLEDVQEEPEIVKEEPIKEVEKVVGEFADYIFDPNVTSDELGLPVDLIQEFIEDFIAQAKSFKTDLYDSVRNNELDHLKIQSHKLKGVAANLRIQNALDALTVINSSDDTDELLTTLDNLYRMIDRLSDEPSTEAVTEEVEEVEEEDFVLSFKNETKSEPSVAIEDEQNFAEDEILDSDVPDNISLPELADDEFLKPVSESIIEDELPTLDDVHETEEIVEDEVYDKAVIAEDFGLDIESFNELFKDYLHESKEMIDTISQAADENNLTACKTTASKMKGMSDNMRIHKFDEELDEIINAKSSKDVKEHVKTVSDQLIKISNSEDN